MTASGVTSATAVADVVVVVAVVDVVIVVVAIVDDVTAAIDVCVHKYANGTEREKGKMK